MEFITGYVIAPIISITLTKYCKTQFKEITILSANKGALTMLVISGAARLAFSLLTQQGSTCVLVFSYLLHVVN